MEDSGSDKEGESKKGRRVIATNRELWVEGIKWRWDEKGLSWEGEDGE